MFLNQIDMMTIFSNLNKMPEKESPKKINSKCLGKRKSTSSDDVESAFNGIGILFCEMSIFRDRTDRKRIIYFETSAKYCHHLP